MVILLLSPPKKMFVPLLLCGGFGTRLERDLKAAITEQGSKNGNEPLGETGAAEPQQYGNLPPLEELLGLPKGLLPVNRKPLQCFFTLVSVVFPHNSSIDIYDPCKGNEENG